MQLVRVSESVYTLQWTGEGRFNIAFVEQFNACLDELLADPGARCLITTGTGKIYSNGLDLATIMSASGNGNLPPHQFLTQHYCPLLARVLTLPLVTIAAVQGHAYAGGLVLALAHDHVVMRQDKGYLCMNEVLLPATIPPGMAEIVKGRVHGYAVRRDCMLQARKFTAQEAARLGIIDAVASADRLVDACAALGTAACRSFKQRAVVASIKERLHAQALAALKIPVPPETFAPFKSKM